MRFLEFLLISLPAESLDTAWCMGSQNFRPARITKELLIHSPTHSFILQIEKSNISIRHCPRQHVDTVAKKDKHYPCSFGIQSQNGISEYN